RTLRPLPHGKRASCRPRFLVQTPAARPARRRLRAGGTHRIAARLRAGQPAGPRHLAMMEGALQVSEMQVRDIMVPRAQMIVVEETAELKEFLPIIIESGHSRFPVVDRKGQVVGILLAKDLLPFLADKSARRFLHKDVLRPAVFVPESKRLNILLREFRSSRNHLAIVVDEYGGVAGLVSIEDVIEQIVGDIADEHDITDVGFVKPHGANRYTVKARMPIAEFNAYFGTDFNDADVDTIGGLVLRE